MSKTRQTMPDGRVRETELSPDGILAITDIDTHHDPSMEYIQRVRNEDIVDPSFAPDSMMELQIPEMAYHLLIRKHPDLGSNDNDIATKAWKKFIASSESKPYRVKKKRAQITQSQTSPARKPLS